MKTTVRVGGRDVTIEWTREGETIRLSGESTELEQASAVEVEPGVWSVLWRGRSFEVRASDGHVVDPRAWTGADEGAGAHGRQSITAPMPGKVVRVLVQVGDTVAAGQGVVVVEAMKMQNELKAARAGVVMVVRAKEGMTVAAGEILVTIE